MLSHVLFDVDGVLVDSAAMHTATWGAWADLRQINKALMFADIHGERGIDTITRVAPHLTPEVELEVLAEILREHEHAARVFTGAAELLLAHADRSGLVTSGPRDQTLARFQRLDLPVPSVIVCGEDVSHGKPHPEPYLLGCQLLDVTPENCVVVEDAPAGIASAKAAGCYVIGVSTGAAIDGSPADEVLADLPAVGRRLQALLSQTTPR